MTEAGEPSPCTFAGTSQADPAQPRVSGAPLRSKLRHYTNLDVMAEKLEQLVREFAWGRMDVLALREAQLATELAA